MSNVIVFDLDGVITSEEAYWITAGLVLHELLYSPRYWNISHSDQPYQPVGEAQECRRVSQATLPEDIILSFKARAINSNWDTCYAGVCICLIDLLAQLPDASIVFPLRPWDMEWITTFRQALASMPAAPVLTEKTYARLQEPFFQSYSGLELFDLFNKYASDVLKQPVAAVFERSGPFWTLCHDLFQEWYLGDKLFTQEYGYSPSQSGKPGCILFERPLLPVEQLRSTLETLCEQGFTLGVATGRPGAEATVPLQNYDLWRYFDQRRVVTHAEAVVAEAKLRAQGDLTSLVKPHPYQFLAAADPLYQPHAPLPRKGSFVVIGDTPSDVRGGRAAGAITVAVLTGARTNEARTLLKQSQPDFLLDDVTQLPALLERLDDLATIQRLQFTEREKAEILLQRWFARHMDLHVERVTLMPKPVSLNSFNGVYQIGDEKFFFKTHVEEQGIVEEYYHAEMLFQAGYNVVRPLRTVHEKDQQMVIYPVIDWPVMFDLMRAVETGQPTFATVDLLAAAEALECQRLLAIYQKTLAMSTADEHAKAPIHQLFWHRLTGGRLANFYQGKVFDFPNGAQLQGTRGLLFEDVLHYRWTINGVEVQGPAPTLGDLIEQATRVLHPKRAMMTAVGHGDAHFGNVFLQDQTEYLYFDPAFAGRHSPLLDIVKPFFHNVFAMWMYFPQEIMKDLQLTLQLRDDHIIVEHNYHLPPVRQAILQTKIASLVKPLIALLREQHALPDDWSDIFRLALMCCPLLTVDLLDREKRSAAICWLGLSQVMQMGNLPLM